MSIFGGSTTQKVDNRPWETQRHYLSRGFRGAEAGVFDRPLFYYPGRTVTPFSRPTRTGLSALMGRAMMGNPLNPASQQQVMNTLGGSYLTGPGMQQIQDSIISAVKPDVQSTFALAGGSGDPLASEALGRGVARGMSPFIDAERNRMMQASSMAPSLAREDYYDMDRLLGVGGRYEDLHQRRIQDAMNRWDFAQNEPYTRMQRYMQLIGGAIPGKVESSSSGGGSPFAQIAGLGLAGLGTAGSLGWQPFA